MKRRAGALGLFGLLAGVSAVRAADLGVLGPTYGIAEPHLLDFLRERLAALERSGRLEQLKQQARERAIHAVRSPQPVADLRATEKPRSFFVDPSLTLDRPIVDAAGRTLFAAGTRTNPLDLVSLSRRLLFFDARDPRQVGQARELIARHPGRIKPILTGGSYLDLMAAWRMPVYFDQQGRLVGRLGIRQVPALVSQDGRRLRVDEMVLP